MPRPRTRPWSKHFDPDPGVTNAIRAWIDDDLTGQIAKQIGPVDRMVDPGKAIEIDRWRFVYDIYDAMVFWMGPRGDPDFLVMHLVEHGRLPPFYHKSGVSGPGYDGFGRNRTLEFFHIFCEKNYIEHGSSGLNLGVCPYAMVLHPAADPGDSHYVYGLAVAPEFSYRTDLMGELASPWSTLDPSVHRAVWASPPSLVRRPS